MVQLVYFPEAFLELQMEISWHPELQTQLTTHSAANFEARLAEICTYCGVIVDGLYGEEELTKLATILTDKLREKRTGILLPH